MPTYKRARLGIGRTYQRVEIFPDMTVRDHLLVAERARRARAAVEGPVQPQRPHPRGDDRVDAVARAGGDRQHGRRSGLDPRARLLPSGRAGPGAGRRPRAAAGRRAVLGLDIHETRELSQVLQMLQRERGMAVLLVEHDLSMVASVVDRTIVMNLGAVIAEGTFDEVMADPAVRQAYLGPERVTYGRRDRAAEQRSGSGSIPAPPPALEVDHVSASYGPYRALFDVSFTVPRPGGDRA
jgi:branched-chain amino acid transport system ATP-binding protein